MNPPTTFGKPALSCIAIPLLCLLIISFAYFYGKGQQIQIPFTNILLQKSALLILLSVISFIPFGLFLSQRGMRTHENLLFGVCFVAILFASTIVVFAQKCMDYGIYDTSIAYTDPRIRLLHKSARFVHPIRDPGECLYYSGITWVTVGYGDVIPTRRLRAFATAEAVVAYIIMAYLFALMMEIHKGPTPEPVTQLSRPTQPISSDPDGEQPPTMLGTSEGQG